MQVLKGYIAGRWMDSISGERLVVRNPATGEKLAEVPWMGEQETREAIDAANAAMKAPASLEDRRRWLNRVADALDAQRDAFARTITLEQGKPLRESLAEVSYSAGFFRFFAAEIDVLLPREVKNQAGAVHWRVHHRPAGVAGLITPWNFPLAMLAKKVAAAMAAGCAVVAKPAELTPISAVLLWQVFARLDLPPGLVNLVMGQPREIGQILCVDPRVRLISFTGSTAVGRLLNAQAAPHLKRLSLELGGNAPLLVFEDADLDATADAIIANKFRAGGQTCVCANRIYVERKACAPLVERLASRIAALRVGNGMDPATHIGPLINRAGFEKAAMHVRDAISRGATRVVGADIVEPESDFGFFFPPTLLTGLRSEMRICSEETFGPVVAVGEFDSENEAVALANATEYGLAAYLFTHNAERAARLAARIHSGHLAVNTAVGPTPEAPFGGVKQSGFGREGGVEGLMEFTETQTVATAASN